MIFSYSDNEFDRIFKSILLTLFVSFQVIYSQQDVNGVPDKKTLKKIEKNIRTADFHFEQERYIIAVNYYLEVYDYTKNNSEINFKIGVCYINSPFKYKSLNYFNKAYELDSMVHYDILFYLGLGNQVNYNFKQAIQYYKKYKEKIQAFKNEEDFIKILDKKISECRYGLEVIKKPLSVKIENIGKEINTEFSDYRPFVINNNELLYTSRREKTVGTKLDPFASYYYDNIYSSEKKDDTWIASEKMPAPLNTQVNDAIVGVSADGKKIIVYNDQTNAGDLFISEYKNGNWTTPDRIPVINTTKHNESSATFSLTGDTIFYVSDREDVSIGGKDIFYSIKDDKGKWSEPVNLGKKINTIYNEEAVCMHPNGQKLFFSSEGHNSIGGYDIFVTTKENNSEWGIPVNIGYPINTTDDDLYFYITANNIAYYSAIKEEGYGDNDIYKIQFEPEQLYAIKREEPKPVIEPEPQVVTKVTDSIPEKEPEIIAKKPTEKPEVNFGNMKDEEVIDKIFEPIKLDKKFEREKIVLAQAKSITNKLIKENKTLNIDVIKRNPTKVIVQVIDVSSEKGLSFSYPSGGKGTFVLMMPENIQHDVKLDQKELAVTIGKKVLVSSKVKNEMISNNIISVSEEDINSNEN